MPDRKPLVQLDLSIFEKNGKADFAQIIRRNKQKTSRALNDFLNGIKNEAIDSKETTRIIGKYMVNQQLNKKEEAHLKLQVYDLLKIIGIGVPFVIIPGATLLIPFIVKAAEKKGVDLMPSNFKSKSPSDQSRKSS